VSVTKIDCYCFTANVTNLVYIVSYTAKAKCIVSGGNKGMNQSSRLVETMKNLLPVNEQVTFSHEQLRSSVYPHLELLRSISDWSSLRCSLTVY
jgi:hypothetical protein